MRRRGQAAVETALVMPLFVFLVLGLLQLTLLHQARLLTKYAAYKAARAGSLGNAGGTEMYLAALAALVPITVAGAAGEDRFFRADTPRHWGESWKEVRKNRPYPGFETLGFANVRICNPTRPMIDAAVARGRSRGLQLSLEDNGLDFDDPWITGTSWHESSVTRLDVQVTFYYRMPIPFANGVLWTMARGVEDDTAVQVLRMTPGKRREGVDVNAAFHGGRKRTIASDSVQALADQHIYIVPIRASWGMQMQSKYWPERDGYDFFEAQNNCRVPWRKQVTP